MDTEKVKEMENDLANLRRLQINGIRMVDLQDRIDNIRDAIKAETEGILDSKTD